MLEPTEIARWERLTDAMLDHAGRDDPEAFAQVVAVLDRARAKLPAVALMLRYQNGPRPGGAESGYTWSQIARAMRVSRQAAHRRFGRVPC